MQDLITQAHTVIDNNLYINIASVSVDGKPWNTPVYAVHNNQLTFYWRSWINAQHSQNILTNPKVCIAIYDSSKPLGTNHLGCVYLEAESFEVTDETEIAQALEMFTNNNLTVNDFMGDNVKRVYKAIPTKCWLNDKSESQVTAETVKMRIEVPLFE